MSEPVRILGVAGSLRRDSYNRAALRAATQLVQARASKFSSLTAFLVSIRTKSIAAANASEDQ